jgi:hypothetical protein
MGCLVSSAAKPFGGDLSVLYALAPELPRVLELCGAYLERAPAAHDGGLFRTPSSRYVDFPPHDRGVLEALRANPAYAARVAAIRRYRKASNAKMRGTASAIPWAAISDPLVVAGLYKLFFRQLEPPLLTYALFDKWAQAQHQDNELAYVVTMRSLFGALPRANQQVLLHALHLFRTLLKPRNARKNGLTRKILAHEFGPLFLRPLRVGQGARARYRDRDAMTTDAVAVTLLERMLTKYDHLFTRRNEDEFVRLARENERLRAKQAEHDVVVARVRAERHAHQSHKHYVIASVARKSRMRRALHGWRSNVRAIRGDRTVFDQLRATREALDTALERNKQASRKIEGLRLELEQSRRRAEMLDVALGGDGMGGLGAALHNHSVSVS